jgi:mannonate dehydratase
MSMKVVANAWDLSDDYLRWACQIGLDGVDIGGLSQVPGMAEQGYPHAAELLALTQRIRSWGLSIHRVSLPSPDRFMRGEAGGKEDLDNLCRTIACYGEAGIPIGRVGFAWESTPIHTTHQAEHRGGYKYRGFDLELWQQQLAESSHEKESIPEDYWDRVKAVYERIIPIAEEADVKIAIHPSDPPLPGASFNSLGFHRVLDAHPSDHNGFLYCVGTRCEAGGTQVVLDEINKYGRMGKIFHVHFRNVRGSLATTGGFEEVLLDDGDMNMFQILLALRNVGYEGALNPDHYPHIGPETPELARSYACPSYSVGYIKALLAAVTALPQAGAMPTVAAAF